MRKLASIRTIKEIKPIENADALELAIVDGWNCVVKKGEFVVGQKGVYFEIDSFLPLGSYFDFLAKSGTKKLNGIEGIRIKTIRLRGQISQGLMLPLSAFNGIINEDIEIGEEVTELLGVEKYEVPEPAHLAGNIGGNFPSFIKKTDQERIQNLFDEYKEKYKDVEFEVSLKLDGSSMTTFNIDTSKYSTKKIEKLKMNGENFDSYFGVCSRNFELTKNEENTFWKVAIEKELDSKIYNFCQIHNRNLSFQGELMGPGIQGNRENLTNFNFFLFDIWDIDNQKHLKPKERLEIAKQLNIVHTPILFERLKVFEKFKTIEEILAFAEVKSLNNEIGEGVVFKSCEEINGEIISFKAISNLFLLKEK